MVFQTPPLPTALDRIAPQAARVRRPPHGGMATSVAVLGHAAALAALLCLATRPLPEPADSQGYALVLTQPAPARLATPAAPALPAQPSADAPRVPPAAAPQVRPTSRTRVMAQQRGPAVMRPGLHAVAAAHPAQAAPPKPADGEAAAAAITAAPAPATENGRALADLETDIDAAVRHRAVMPAAAIRQRREGRAQVRFSYVDGAVDNVAVAQSSQSRLLDDAALLAVRTASYPVPPPGLRGRRLALQVWIDFRVQASPG